METITLDYLKNHHFEKTGLEQIEEYRERVSARFSPSELSALPPSDNEKMNELKILISDLIFNKFKRNYVGFGQKCNVNYETIRKSLRYTNGRNISRETLAKIVIGTGLSLDEANHLFECESRKLDPQNTLLDAVVVHCLENHYDIDEFFETCKQVNLNITYKE